MNAADGWRPEADKLAAALAHVLTSAEANGGAPAPLALEAATAALAEYRETVGRFNWSRPLGGDVTRTRP